MHYIAEENIFVAIVYKLLEQTKKWNVILNIALNGKQTIKMPKKVKQVRLKSYERKLSHYLRYMRILKVYSCQKIMESKIQMDLIWTNIKTILLAVKATN